MNAFPFFAFLLPVFYILHGFWTYFDFVSAKTIWLMVAEYTLALLIIGGVLGLLLVSFKKGLVAASVLLFVNFYMTPFNDELRRLFGERWFLQQSTWLVVLLILFILFLWRFRKLAKINLRLFRFLNILFILLIVLDIGMFMLRPKQEIPLKAGIAKLTAGLEPVVDRLPNVYFILLDEYAGRESLKKWMNFDNSAFVSDLRSRGFFVADSSLANYNSTLYSMGSIWNLEYLPVSDADTSFKSDAGMAFRYIADAFLPEFLISQGYSFYNNSWFYMSKAVRMQNPSYGPSERGFISSQTFLNRYRRNGLLSLALKLQWPWLVSWAKDENRHYNMAVRKNLMEFSAASLPTPTFVYTHFAMPHYPYFFDRNGQPYQTDSLLKIKDTSRIHYVEYLQYCNREVLEMVDSLKERNNGRFQIFIVSDHGFRKLYGDEWGSAAFDNLFAFYDSNVGNQPFPHQRVANVNIFRYWINNTFNASLPILPDSTLRVVFD